MAAVGCAGMMVADTFCGPLPRLPLAGELLAVERMPGRAGGCAANVAIDVVKQGIAADLCGAAGADALGEGLIATLRAADVGCGQIRRLETLPTGQTIILLVTGEDRRYIHLFGANAGFEIGQIDRRWIDGLKVFYLGGFFALPAVRADELADLLDYCRRRGVVTVVDVVVPSGHRGLGPLETLLPRIDYFIPNDDEAERLTGLADPEAQAARFIELGAGTAIITQGAAGALAVRGRRRWRSGAYPVETIDPSGSGDAFAAGIIAGIVQGWEMAEMLPYAAALGASAATAIGTTDGVFAAPQAAEFVRRRPLAVEQVEL